jgi:hypothetical protein
MLVPLMRLFSVCALASAAGQWFNEFVELKADAFREPHNPELMLDAWAFIRVEAALIRQGAGNLKWLEAHNERRKKFHAQFAPFCAHMDDFTPLIAPRVQSGDEEVDSPLNSPLSSPLNEAFGAVNVSFIEQQEDFACLARWLPAGVFLALCAWLPCKRKKKRPVK